MVLATFYNAMLTNKFHYGLKSNGCRCKDCVKLVVPAPDLMLALLGWTQ